MSSDPLLTKCNGREVSDIAIDLRDPSTVPADVMLPRLCFEFKTCVFLTKCLAFCAVVGACAWALTWSSMFGMSSTTLAVVAVMVFAFTVVFTCSGLPTLLGGLCSLDGPPFVEPIRARWRPRPASVLVVHNPKSGRLKAGEVMATVRERLEDQGIRYEEWQTTGVGCARAILPTAKGHDAVISVGGDGTCNEVVNALHDSGIPVCVLPAGSGNALAATLRRSGCHGQVEEAFTPQEAVAMAMDALEKGSAAKLDLLEVDFGNGRSLVCAVFAFFGLIGEVTIVSDPLRSCLGPWRYDLAAVWQTLKQTTLGSSTLDLVLEDGSTLSLEDELAACSLTIGQHWTDKMRSNPGGVMDDGYVELLLFKAMPRFTALRTFLRINTGSHEVDPALKHCLEVYKITKATFSFWDGPGRRSLKPGVVNLDGEIFAHRGKVVFTVKPQALTVFAQT